MPNALDLVIAAALTVAFVGGWQLGFVARASSWLGLVVGLAVGARTLPWMVDRLAGQPPSRVFVAIGLVLLVSGSTGLVLGLMVGIRLRVVVSGARIHPADRAAGGLVSCAGVLLVVWLLVPVMADVRQWPAQQARNSQLARLVDTVLPSPPDSIQALGQVVGESQFPRVLDALQPTPALSAPPELTGIDPGVEERVRESVLRVEGVACRRVQVGTGFVVAPDLVLTNAHVIAGEPTTRVRRDDGAELDAVAVLFDPQRDLAVLRVEGLGREPLELRAGEVGDSGGVFGHPAGVEVLRVAPFEIGRALTATGRDIYGELRVRRDVYTVASALEAGDSGAPLVAPDGSAVGMAFAVAPDRDTVAYALTAGEILDALDTDLRGPVDTGRCLA